MKNINTPLHILLSVASLLGFLGGWATLAHSRKPIQNTADNASAQAIDPLPALAPLPALDGSTASTGTSAGQFTFSPQSQPSRVRSRSFFTTSGS
jgi:hypothetical protein